MPGTTATEGGEIARKRCINHWERAAKSDPVLSLLKLKQQQPSQERGARGTLHLLLRKSSLEEGAVFKSRWDAFLQEMLKFKHI